VKAAAVHPLDVGPGPEPGTTWRLSTRAGIAGEVVTDSGEPVRVMTRAAQARRLTRAARIATHGAVVRHQTWTEDTDNGHRPDRTHHERYVVHLPACPRLDQPPEPEAAHYVLDRGTAVHAALSGRPARAVWPTSCSPAAARTTWCTSCLP